MNKVIFVCLLSLSVCFSKPASDEPGVPKPEGGQPLTEAASIPKSPVETKQPIANNKDVSSKTAGNSTNDVSASPKLGTATDPTHVPVADVDTKKIETKTESVVAAKATDVQVDNKKVTDVPVDNKKVADVPVDNKKLTDESVDNKTANKSTESTTEKKADTKEAGKSDAKEADSKVKTDKPSTAQTTAETPAPKPTASPADDTGKHAIVQSRSFDGASFVGGIILTLSLLAVSFMGFKYYKNQTERNYHTL